MFKTESHTKRFCPSAPDRRFGWSKLLSSCGWSIPINTDRSIIFIFVCIAVTVVNKPQQDGTAKLPTNFSVNLSCVLSNSDHLVYQFPSFLLFFFFFFFLCEELCGKSVRSWCDGSSDRSFMGWTHRAISRSSQCSTTGVTKGHGIC